MKLAFSTLPCMEYSAVQLKELCDRYGFYGAEVRTDNNGEFVHGSGLNITNIGSGFCIKQYDEELLNKAFALIDKMKIYDARAVRVFLGNFAKKFSMPKKELSYEGIVTMLKVLCEYSDCEIWVETHNEFATGRVLNKLIEDVDCDNLKIIWDIIHPIEDGEEPQETWEQIGDRIAHVHIKDGVKSKNPDDHDYVYTMLGEGSLPIAEIISILQKNGFEGCLSLEWESLWREELKQMDISLDELLSGYVEFMNKFIKE